MECPLWAKRDSCISGAKKKKLLFDHLIGGYQQTGRHGQASVSEIGRRRQCPLWVKSRHLQCKTSCPLYLQKRTLTGLFDHLVGAFNQWLKNRLTRNLSRRHSIGRPVGDNIRHPAWQAPLLSMSALRF